MLRAPQRERQSRGRPSARRPRQTTADQFEVGASRSHSGPDFRGLWGGVPPPYREYIVEKTVDAVGSREPATARAGSVEAPEPPSNRRGWGFTGW